METYSETDLDTSAFNSSIQSEVSDNEDADMSHKDSDASPENLSDFMNFQILSSDKAVIGLVHDSKFYFKGKLSIKVLKGKLEIQGTILNPSQEFVAIYSPKGYSLLYCQGFRDDPETNSSSSLEEESATSEEVSSRDCVFIAQQLGEKWCDFLTDNLKKSGNKINLFRRDQAKKSSEEDQNNVFSELEETLDINILPRDYSCVARLFEVGEGWELAVQSAELSRAGGLVPRLVLAGGKGVGKSTLLRWLTNRLLARSGRNSLLHNGIVMI